MRGPAHAAFTGGQSFALPTLRFHGPPRNSTNSLTRPSGNCKKNCLMPFEFFGTRRKVVIAMAHIGALPGTPLYDADGGVDKLIEGVARDIEKLQAGGVHAIMFG